jgi:alanine racemase
MDQVVVDLGPDNDARAGDEVVLFGPDPSGPTAQAWADATDTISYEIVTRIGPRVPRVHVGTAGTAVG